jgi:hypothetical protein
MGHETYSLVKDVVASEERSPIKVKEFGEPIRCYKVVGLYDDLVREGQVIREEHEGFKFMLELQKRDKQEAITTLEAILARLRSWRNAHPLRGNAHLPGPLPPATKSDRRVMATRKRRTRVVLDFTASALVVLSKVPFIETPISPRFPRHADVTKSIYKTDAPGRTGDPALGCGRLHPWANPCQPRQERLGIGSSAQWARTAGPAPAKREQEAPAPFVFTLLRPSPVGPAEMDPPVHSWPKRRDRAPPLVAVRLQQSSRLIQLDRRAGED